MMRPATRLAALALAGLVGLGPAMPAGMAQEAVPAGNAAVEDAAALIRKMEERIAALDQAAREREAALSFLASQIEAARGAIEGGDETTAAFRQRAAALSTELEAAAEDRERLSSSAEESRDRLEELRLQAAALDQAVEAERAARAATEAETAGLRREVAAAGERERALGARLAEQEARLEAVTGELAAARDAASGAEGRLGEQAGRIADLEGRLAASESEARTLRANLDVALEGLAGSQEAIQAREGEIAKLNEALRSAALESEVAELAQYRSEFFGRLRQVLGERADVRIVGDRFVFQAEVLFASGSAALDPGGEAELRALAQGLEEVAATIPPDLGWILRVDGHTDRRPISNELFRSNWDLSAARAIAVVEALVRLGVPAEHLAATGFGEWQPLDPAEDEIAYRRNRRIELKLTER
jgi:chemotaxis protein MotB